MVAVIDSTPTLSISVKDSLSATLQVADRLALGPVWIPHHYSHINTHQLAYQGTLNNSNSPSDTSILQNSIDIVTGGDETQIRTTLGDGSVAMLRYGTVSIISWYAIIDWLNYADANGYRREDGFFHCADSAYGLADSTFGAQGFPVSWWWDARLVSHTGSVTPLYGGSPTANLAGTSTFLTDGTPVTLGADVCDYLLVGMSDPFDEIKFTFSTFASGGWAGVLEYPTAVDTDGVPTTWTAVTVLCDTTSSFTANGKVRFTPGTDWLPSISVSGTIDSTQAGMLWDTLTSQAKRGYYLRLRTTSTGTTPVVSDARAADYTGQGDSFSNGGLAKIPVFDASADLDGDGYLNDTEYANRHTGWNARFLYQSRMPSTYGTQTLWGNVRTGSYKLWCVDYMVGQMDANLDGIFMDSSGISNLYSPRSQTVEDPIDVDTPYGAALKDIWLALGSSARGKRFILPNMAANPRQAIVEQVPAFYGEFLLMDIHSWFQFEAIQDTVSTVASYTVPPPIQVLDSFSTYGNTSSRYQILLLAYYYMLSQQGTYFGPLSDNGAVVDTNDPKSDWNPYRWFAAIGTDVGQPTASTSLFASGSDPLDGTKTYKIYQRTFGNALVLYKPISSDCDGVAGTNDDGTATTHSLGRTYYPLAGDGTEGSGICSITLRNAEAAILMTS